MTTFFFFGEWLVSKERLNYRESAEGLNEQREHSGPVDEVLLT